MADYYPLLARAVAGLPPNAPGESRRALYERGRAGLIQQLRSVQPPLSESEITRERLSYEDAVRRAETEAAQRAREAAQGTGSASARESFRGAWPPPPQPTVSPAFPPSPVSASETAREKYAFVSYSSKDKAFAEKVNKILKDNNFATFMASDDIEASDEWQATVLREIEKTTCFVALVSKEYLGSPYCLQESGIAVHRKIVILPLSIDGTDPPGFMHLIQAARVNINTFNVTDLLPVILRLDAKLKSQRKN
jgi:hypothetical protein